LQEVDRLNKTLTIRRANTKTDAGARIVPLNEMACWAVAGLQERAKKVRSTGKEHYLLPACRYRHTKQGKSAGLGFDPTRPMQGWRTAWRTHG
jgi:hypothetical protein